MALWEEFWNLPQAFAITAGVAGAVIGPLFFWVRGRRLLPMQRLRVGHWSGREVWLAFLLFFLVPNLAFNLLDSLGFYDAIGVKAPSLRVGLWTSPLATLLILALVFWVLFQTSRTRPSHLGLSCARWPQNTVLGYLGFLVLTPLILGLYALVLFLLRLAFDATPDEHQLTKLSKEPLMLLEWSLLMGEAILAVPLVEELLFRGVLQGWLRRASLPGHIMMIVVTLGWGLLVLINSLLPVADQPVGEVNVGPLVFAIVVGVGYGFALYRVGVPANGEQKNTVLPILGSAMVFAAFHSEVWPTPIPLFFLGIGLGYLAYRTQSLLPGIIVHGLFNAVACVELVLKQTSVG